jgi:hypothetical protein
MDMEAFRESVDSFLENPHWRTYHDEAPSEACRKYVELDFYYSDTEDEEAAETMDALEPSLTAADWEHLKRYAGNTPFRITCDEMIRKLNGLP